MMNCFYPLEIRDEEAAAEKLAGTCLCVVEVDGETGLALTGGGMDLSWEICEAFMILGSLPPAHFVRRLPRMADTMSDKHRLVLAGAIRTLTIQKEWAEKGLEEIERVRSYFENQEWRRG